MHGGRPPNPRPRGPRSAPCSNKACSLALPTAAAATAIRISVSNTTGCGPWGEPSPPRTPCSGDGGILRPTRDPAEEALTVEGTCTLRGRTLPTGGDGWVAAGATAIRTSVSNTPGCGSRGGASPPQTPCTGDGGILRPTPDPAEEAPTVEGTCTPRPPGDQSPRSPTPTLRLEPPVSTTMSCAGEVGDCGEPCSATAVAV